MKIIFTILILLLIHGNSFSQSKLLWQENTLPDQILSADILNETEYVCLFVDQLYKGTLKENKITARYFINTFSGTTYDLEISRSDEKIFIVVDHELMIFDFDLNLLNTIKLNEYNIPGDFRYSGFSLFTIQEDLDKIALLQTKIDQDDNTFQRIVFYNYDSGSLLDSMYFDNTIAYIKYTIKGNYFLVGIGEENKINFYSADKNEYLFEIKDQKTDGSINFYSAIHNSNSGNYIITVFHGLGLENDIMIYDILKDKTIIESPPEFINLGNTLIIEDDKILVTGQDDNLNDINYIYSFPEMELIEEIKLEMLSRDVFHEDKNNIFLTYESFEINAIEYQQSTNVINDQNSDLKVFPNPTSNILSINNKQIIDKYNISDVSGNILLDNENLLSDKLKIDISKLPTGIYFIELLDIEGNIHTQKFIKQ